MKKNCLFCHKEFSKNYNTSKKAFEKSKYCSKSCGGKYRTATGIMPPSRKGAKPWNLGKKLPYEVWNNGMKGFMAGESNPMHGVHINKGDKNNNWKGDLVGYTALHDWIKRRLIKPIGCNHCGEIKPLDLANKSHEYKRELTDWLWLCKSCHRTYDKNNKTANMHFLRVNGKYSKRKEIAIYGKF